MQLPDGSEITLNAERFQCAEILFDPKILDVETPGIAELVFRAINKAPLDTREALYQHIVLSGDPLSRCLVRAACRRDHDAPWATDSR